MTQKYFIRNVEGAATGLGSISLARDGSTMTISHETETTVAEFELSPAGVVARFRSREANQVRKAHLLPCVVAEMTRTHQRRTKP
jgi:hypothetical protein